MHVQDNYKNILKNLYSSFQTKNGVIAFTCRTKLEEESGVYQALEKSDKKFISLHIRKLDKDGKPLWWLNPLERGKYNFGRYTTEQLHDWAEDKGEIVKKR